GAGSAASAFGLTLARGALQTSIGTKLLPVVALLLVAGLATFALVAGASPEEQRANTPLPQPATAEPQDREKRPEKEPEPEKRNDKPEKPAPVRVATDLHGDPLPPGALARLGTVRFRVLSGGTFITFLPGDKTLMTAGQTLSTWEIATGKELHRWDCNKGGSV